MYIYDDINDIYTYMIYMFIYNMSYSCHKKDNICLKRTMYVTNHRFGEKKINYFTRHSCLHKQYLIILFPVVLIFNYDFKINILCYIILKTNNL